MLMHVRHAMYSALIERSTDSVSTLIMLIVVQVDVHENISLPHAKAVMSRIRGLKRVSKSTWGSERVVRPK